MKRVTRFFRTLRETETDHRGRRGGAAGAVSCLRIALRLQPSTKSKETNITPTAAIVVTEILLAP